MKLRYKLEGHVEILRWQIKSIKYHQINSPLLVCLGFSLQTTLQDGITLLKFDLARHIYSYSATAANFFVYLTSNWGNFSANCS